MKAINIRINKSSNILIWIAIMISTFIIKDYTSFLGEVLLAVIIVVNTVLLGYRVLLNKFSERILGELEIINTIFILFMIPSLYRCVNNIRNIVFVLCFFGCISYIWLILLIKYGKNWIYSTKDYISRNACLFIGIIFIVLLRIPQFGTIPKWDAQIYSYCLSDACLNFDYSCDKFIRYFSIASHTSWGYTFLSSIVEFWKPFSNYSLSILGIILTIFTFMAIYEISKEMGNINSFFAMLSAIIVTTTPIFSGTYTYYTLDFGVACLYFILLFFWVRKYELLTFIFSLLLCLTKEPVGILFVAGLLLHNMLKCYIKNRSIKAFFYTSFREPSNYSFTLSILLCLLGFLKMFSGSEQPIWDVVQQEGKTLNYFSWNPSYIMTKSMQVIFINFAWLSLFLIIVSIVIIMIKKIELYYDIFALFTGTFLYIVCSFLYYTYAIPRYNIIIYMIINYIACYFICVIIQSKRLRSAIMILLCMLFSIQTYFNIDFIMMNIFPTVSTGKYQLCNTSINQDYLGDYIVYNYMYSYFDNIILSVLNDVKYTGHEDIFILGTDDDSFVGGNKILAPIYYDNVKRKWSLLSNENTIYVESRGEAVWDDPEAVLSDTALAIIIPYYNFDFYEKNTKVESYYEISSMRSVNTFYGSAEYWILNNKR